MSHSISVHVTRVGLTQRKDRDKTHKVLEFQPSFIYIMFSNIQDDNNNLEYNLEVEGKP